MATGSTYGSTGSSYTTQDTEQAVFSKKNGEINTNIIRIASEVSKTERLLRLVGTRQDSNKIRNSILEASGLIKQMVTETNTNLADLTHSTHSSSISRSQRLALERSRNEFAQTVSKYGKVQNTLVEKLKIPLSEDVVRPGPTQPEARPGGGISRTTTWGLEEDETDDRPLISDEERLQQQQLQADVEFETEMIREREAAIRQIEADLLDINQIFRDLAAMVAEQGEVIDTIEDHIEKAFSNVEEGNVQLIKASQYQKKYRRKLCCMVFILIVVAGVVALIVALSVKK